MRSNASRASRSGSSKKREVISGAIACGACADSPSRRFTWSGVTSARTSARFATTFASWSRLPGQWAPVSAASAGGGSAASSGADGSPRVASRQNRSISGGMSSRRVRSGGSITAPTDSCDSSAASNLPSAARLPSGSALAHTSVVSYLSSLGSRNASPFCSTFE